MRVYYEEDIAHTQTFKKRGTEREYKRDTKIEIIEIGT